MRDLEDRGGINLEEYFIDGTFAPAKKGDSVLVKRNGERVRNSWQLQTALPHEVRLVENTVERIATSGNPRRLIGDRAYDSDPLDQKLMRNHVKLIAPHKGNRVREKTQDERVLRRYKKRWKVERLFAWLQNFSKIVVRYEYYLANYERFVLLGCIMILIKYL